MQITASFCASAFGAVNILNGHFFSKIRLATEANVRQDDEIENAVEENYKWHYTMEPFRK